MTSSLVIYLTIFSYLIGSISSAIIVSQIMGLPDPRKDGSNNPGATNVLRLGGKTAAAIVLIFDVLKSLLPVLAGHLLELNPASLALVGMAAVLGHVFPLYYRFAGGKGVATALGCYFGLYWLLGLISIAIWLICLLVFRFSSLSSLIMVSFAPVVGAITLGSSMILLPFILIAFLIAYKHKENILRLRAGTEPYTKLFG